MHLLSKCAISVSLFLFLFSVVFAQKTTLKTVTVDELLQTIENMNSLAGMENASWGICVMDANTGEIIAQHDLNRALVTASTMKVITTATALGVLGSDFRFETHILYSGEIEDSVLKGNLYIQGSGDPSLGSDRWGAEHHYNKVLEKWAKEVKKAGIKWIEGDIIGDGSTFSTQGVPENWGWADMGNYYGSGAYGLNFNENKYSLFLKSGSNVGDAVSVQKTIPKLEYVQFISELTSGADGSGDNAYIYGAPFTNIRYIRGTIPRNKNNFEIKGSIPDAEQFCADLFWEKLQKEKIEITGKSTSMRMEKLLGNTHYQDKKLIYKHLSPPLSKIVYWTNVESLNLCAEALMMKMGEKQKGKATTEAGIEATKEYWAARGVSVQGMFIKDGSGLSPNNALSPYQMSQILQKISRESYYSDFYNSLPIAGKTGTLESVCQNTAAEGNLHAKSGFIERVRCYAGYVKTRAGRTLCFAAMANQFNDSPSNMKKRWEKIFVKMAELE